MTTLDPMAMTQEQWRYALCAMLTNAADDVRSLYPDGLPNTDDGWRALITAYTETLTIEFAVAFGDKTLHIPGGEA